jgi:hypothetical protein
VSIRRLVQLLFAVLALGLVSSAGATTSMNGRIAFSSNRDGNSELYSVGPDGASGQRLTWTSASESSPAWSPDGTKIAYSRADIGGRMQIWVMDANGAGQTQLSPATTGNVDETTPTWSPDGSRIAFASTRGGTWNLWLINPDGSGLTKITDVFSNSPSWSPDGMQLAYVGLNGIGVVGVDGSNPHTVTAPGTFPSSPAWSPDGRHIVFTRNDANGYGGELYVAGADGSGEVQLTSGGLHNGGATWSPDGTKIVFGRSADTVGGSSLWTINPDGSGLTQLTSGGDALGPDWGTSQVVPQPSPPDAPSIDIFSPTDGGIYFPGTSSIAFYQCTSAVTYIATCEGDVPFLGQLDLSTAGTHTFTVRATDGQGRTASKTVTYEVLDLTPPQIDVRTPSDGATYELGANLTVDYSCSDPGGSGIAVCSGDLPDGVQLDTWQIGTHTFNVFAFDNVRHLTQTRVTYTVIDTRPPRIDIGSPVDGASYSLGAGVSASFSCWSPGRQHIASCNGTVPNGALIDTASIGSHTFTVNAADDNGKSASASATYLVTYAFKGFDSPVDANGTISDAKAGDAIALKFSLTGDQGLSVISKTTWQPASCTDWTPIAAATSADAKLSYSSPTDRYRNLVTTSSSWKGTCRILRLGLADSTSHEVHVRFK